MSDDDPRLLSLLLGQPARHADLERGDRLPSCIAGVEPETDWECFETGYEDTVCEAL